MKKMAWIPSILLSITPERTVCSEQQLKVDEVRIRKDVKFLTSTSMPRHYKNKGALKETTDYIKKVFAENAESTEVQRFRITDGTNYENIIASFGPMDGERFIIGAHYDVYGNYPGADDNASGVAALLEIARLLKKEETTPKHRIDLVAYALEEPPFFGSEDMGSAHHANKLHEEKAKVKLMLALDMIGYFTDEPNSQERPFPLQAIYPSTGNFISVVGSLSEIKNAHRIKKLMLEGAKGLHVEAVNAPSVIPGIDFSDHRNFWKYDYPALMITDTAFYRNPNYHTEKDTVDTLDYPNMAKVIEALYFAALKF